MLTSSKYIMERALTSIANVDDVTRLVLATLYLVIPLVVYRHDLYVVVNG